MVVWWCFCGGVVVFLCWCFCGVFVVFLWWCFWGGVLWWCFCGGVLVNWHYSPPVGSLANSQHSCQIIATSPLHATPVDRSLVMRALGGAITSPCSNDSECRRPTPAIFGLYPFLLLVCWLVAHLNKRPKRHSLGDC